MLADEFIEFGVSGKVYGKRQAIEAVSLSSSAEISLKEFSAHALAPNVALLTYRSVKPDSSGSDKHALRSSIWKLTKTGWKLVFHQGTPAASTE